nr:hypothetical protein [uncultured Duncaniella sp.]
MENFKIVDTDTDVSPLMGLIAVECEHPLPVSIAFDFYLFDGCESYAFLTPSVRGFRRAVFSRSKKSIFAESFFILSGSIRRFKSIFGICSKMGITALGFLSKYHLKC